MAINYRFGALLKFSFIKTNKSDCSSQKFVLGPSLVLPDCVGIKTETYCIEGKKYSLTFFLAYYGLTCFELARKRQVCKARSVVDAKIRHDFDRSNNISLLN